LTPYDNPFLDFSNSGKQENKKGNLRELSQPQERFAPKFERKREHFFFRPSFFACLPFFHPLLPCGEGDFFAKVTKITEGVAIGFRNFAWTPPTPHTMLFRGGKRVEQRVWSAQNPGARTPISLSGKFKVFLWKILEEG
jgi:hypothetical protein